MNPFQRLLELKADALVTLGSGMNRAAVAPDLGGRVFVEVGGQFVHRIDWKAVKCPNRPFNNFGGTNLWPAPEGGEFGFNYRGDEWMVQPAINNEPFEVTENRDDVVRLFKRAMLVNRKGTVVEVEMHREVEVVAPSAGLAACGPEAMMAVETRDRIRVMNRVATGDALIAAWNLEQFDATEDTMAFVRVAEPQTAVNFDFYEPAPVDLMTPHQNGFTFRVHGTRRGQIGIRQDAGAERIGFYDLTRRMICLKEHTGVLDGMFFNIADNAQPAGVYSAADSYSIFNSDADMKAFELETIGPLMLDGEWLLESPLSSRTTYAVFERPDSILQFLSEELGDRQEGVSFSQTQPTHIP